MNIYVANIPFSANEEQLRTLFAEHGEVSSAKIITDKFTQQSRGFGFVEMNNDEAAKKAIESLNGYSFMGKTLSVNEARPKTDSGFGGGGGGYKKPFNNGGSGGGGGYKKTYGGGGGGGNRY